MTGYCPNCGGAIEHDGEDAECLACGIEWQGSAHAALKPEPYAPGELEGIHAEASKRFEPPQRGNPWEVARAPQL